MLTEYLLPCNCIEDFDYVIIFYIKAYKIDNNLFLLYS